MSMHANLLICSLIILPMTAYSEELQSTSFGVRPFRNASLISLKLSSELYSAHVLVGTDSAFFAGVEYKYSIFKHLSLIPGFGLGQLTEAGISDKSSLDNPIFPFGLDNPEYDYKLKRLYLGPILSIQSAWDLTDRISLDVDWISLSYALIPLDRVRHEGKVPIDEKINSRVSHWSMTVSVRYKL